MRTSILSLLIGSGFAMAAETTPPPAPPMPPGIVQPGPAALPPGMDPQAMQERRDMDQKWRGMREVAEKDPEVAKLRQASDEAMKAWRDKLDAVMAAQPGYAELKAKREQWRAERMKQMPHAETGAVPGRPPVEMDPAKMPLPPPKP